MNDKLSLTELQLIIKDSIYIGLPGMYWVVAEISEIKENYAGHCYLELVEKNTDEINIRARVRAVIWAKKYGFLRTLFESVTGETLREGFKVLLKVTVEYHEIYGLSLVINDIDPAFTIGEMAVKRRLIIKRLEEEGVINMNKELEFPVHPKRIAVISSKNAAGYLDFVKHLESNSYGYVFNHALFDTSMQGIETETSVITALDMISERIHLFDAVVIIRGGGSQTDLSWFDSYRIAYYVTQFPLPVLTGIGHEKDMTVTDLVAYRSLKTPTAVADFIISTVVETENQLIGLINSISEISISLLEKSKARIDSCRMKLIPVAGSKISEENRKLSSRIIVMVNTGKKYIMKEGIIPANQISRLISATKAIIVNRERTASKHLSDIESATLGYYKQAFTRIGSFSEKLSILNPVNVLKRGYTITSLDGHLIKSAAVLKRGDIIDTQFSDGTINSEVKN